MSFKNSVTFLTVFVSCIFSDIFYVVVGPLGCEWEGADVSKEFLVHLVGGYKPVREKRGRASPLQAKTFDNTMGFPGEDGAAQPQQSSHKYSLSVLSL